MNKARSVLAAAAITATIGGGALIAAPAFAATDDVRGEATITLDFSVEGETDVQVYTKNLSSVPAYGWATGLGPDGDTYDWGPHFYQPGDEWTFQITKYGYTCDDLEYVSATVYGSRTLGGDVEWTSGLVTYPDPRIIVIGCDTPTPNTPTETPTATPSPSPTSTTGVGGISVVNPAAPAAAAPAAAVAPRTAARSALSETGGTIAWSAIIGGGVLLAAGGTILALRRRRSSEV